MKTSVRLAATLLLSGFCAVAVRANPTSLEAFRHLVIVSDAQISPDGKRVAFVRRLQNFKDDRFDDTLMLVNVAGGEPRALTAGTHEVASPSWSPHGDRLAYLSKGGGAHEQVFVLPLDGGEPRQVTSARRDVEQFAWGPDGARIAYVAEDESAAKPLRRPGNLFELRDDGYLRSEAPRPSHIWLVAADGGTPRRLTSGSWSVLETAPPFVGAPSAPSWSQDGTALTFVRQANADDGDSDRTTIATADATTGRVKQATLAIAVRVSAGLFAGGTGYRVSLSARTRTDQRARRVRRARRRRRPRHHGATRSRRHERRLDARKRVAPRAG